jgi:uncharacterized protein YjbJ (UPF0337 family)
MADYGNWNQFKKHVKHKWGKLTDQDLDEINGNPIRLIAKLEERYGWKGEHAKESLRQFEHELSHANLQHKKKGYPGKPMP